MNRTGIATAIDLNEQMLQEAETVIPSPGTREDVSAACAAAIIEADPIGSIPLPIGQEEADSITLLFIDKLGERLAFERSGTRLWEAFLTKFEALPEEQGKIKLADIKHIRDEELEHFLMLKEAAEQMDCDATAVTPSANIVGVTSIGLVQTVTDPRTNIDQCLLAMLTAELVDNDGWEILHKLAQTLGHPLLARRFKKAHKQEEEHLARVRKWILERSLAELKK